MALRRDVYGGALALLLLAGTCVIVAGMVRGSSSINGYFDLKKSQLVLSQTVAGLSRENNELSSEIERIRNSPSYAKKVLRDKYHVTEPDEDIIFFTD
jgi:cell division protein FtsB